MEIHRPHIQNHKGADNQKKVRPNDLEYVPEDFKKVARGLEQQFVEYMLQQMNKSIGKDENQGTAMDYYQNLSQKERAQIMTSQNNGMGIQELILNQIYPKKFRNSEALAAYQKDKESSLIAKKDKIEMMGPPAKEKVEKHSGHTIKKGREANHE